MAHSVSLAGRWLVAGRLPVRSDWLINDPRSWSSDGRLSVRLPALDDDALALIGADLGVVELDPLIQPAS